MPPLYYWSLESARACSPCHASFFCAFASKHVTALRAGFWGSIEKYCGERTRSREFLGSGFANRKIQKWLWIGLAALIAIQIYYVREMLAAFSFLLWCSLLAQLWPLFCSFLTRPASAPLNGRSRKPSARSCCAPRPHAPRGRDQQEAAAPSRRCVTQATRASPRCRHFYSDAHSVGCTVSCRFGLHLYGCWHVRSADHTHRH